MGFLSGLGGLIGLGGSSHGASFNAQSAPILQGVNTGQTNQAYGQAQTGLGQQQSFINALMAQNGLANQSNVFNQQQGLADQFQGVANGTGPNPALQQFQNTTGQNIAQQAALMAGQRGSGANAGLLARQAAQQGAGIQQQAVGQGAALQAQQQLAALNGLQQQQGMMGNLADTQVNQQGSALNAYNQFAQNNQGQLLNSLGQFNNANVSNVQQQNAANAGIAQQNAKTQGDIFGGVMGQLGRGVMALAAAGGGMVPKSNVGRHLKGMNSGGMLQGGAVPGKAEVPGDSYQNDTVKALLSPGEVVIPRHVMQSNDPAGNSAKFVQAILAKQGRKG